MTTEQQVLIDEVVEELRPAVQAIESRLATTRDHYGDYMQLLGVYPKEQRRTMAVLLIRAGASQAGISWALRLS